MSEDNSKEEEEKVKESEVFSETTAVENKDHEDTDTESVVEKTPEKKEETAADLLGANIEQVKVRKAKGSKNISTGICFIVATFNNTKVSFSDMKGNVISWSSSGKCNFRGSRKSTAYAAQVVRISLRTTSAHNLGMHRHLLSCGVCGNLRKSQEILGNPKKSREIVGNLRKYRACIELYSAS